MKKKSIKWKLFLKVLGLLAVNLAAIFLLAIGKPLPAALLIPLAIWFLYDIYRVLRKIELEVREFSSAIQYRDFSRYFNTQHAPAEVKGLREGFNEMNAFFKEITREKEQQHQYLKQILELVETGIISFDPETGEVTEVNNTLKKMFDLPYLKNLQTLQKRNLQVYTAMHALAPGKTAVILTTIENKTAKVILSASLFQFDGKKNKLIAIQNINEALDENEARAWQKLLGVMTHEIMNSVAPISSLADTLKKRLSDTVLQTVNNKTDQEDIELGLETIKRRSEGLLRFAETYRNLNKITSLNLKKVLTRDLIGNLNLLMQPTFDQKGIVFEVILKNPGLVLEIDVNLIEQALINLLTNAIDAVSEMAAPKIIISAAVEKGAPVITVSDNGKGISPEMLEQIFIPFFSTKKSGSGIGLSLCKQIMLLHSGNIRVQSVEGKGSVFTLTFAGQAVAER